MFARQVMQLPRAALGTLLGGTLAMRLGGVRVLAAEKLPDAGSLSSLYAEAVEAMVNVPGCEAISSSEGVLYLSPASGTPAPVEWPKLISKSVIFSFTAWNPNGQTAPDAANAAANARLEADLDKLRLQPRATWRSFGFNAKEGWREEGFSLAFDPAERRFAHSEVDKLARKYRQAAFYVYTCSGGVLSRETVWVDDGAQRAKEPPVRMTLLPTPPPSELAARGKL